MKYDPNRKYKKGDLVRITGYRGRLFGCGIQGYRSERSTRWELLILIGQLI